MVTKWAALNEWEAQVKTKQATLIKQEAQVKIKWDARIKHIDTYSLCVENKVQKVTKYKGF